MKCEQLVEYLSDYIDNNLEHELMIAAQEHLATCENCRVVLNSTQQMILLYRERGKTQQIPKERHRKLYEQLESVFLQQEAEE